jgi:hypothetical protein
MDEWSIIKHFEVHRQFPQLLAFIVNLNIKLALGHRGAKLSYTCMHVCGTQVSTYKTKSWVSEQTPETQGRPKAYSAKQPLVACRGVKSKESRHNCHQ